MSGRTSSTRPLRRDAADNRERLLAAAETVFARDGVDARIDQVAREAGVGMGTVYRRFPTKKALIDELVDTLRDDMFAVAQRALADDVGGEGLEVYLRAAGALIAERRAFVPMIWRGDPSDKILRLRSTIAQLLARAQQHGTANSDVTVADISMALWSVRGVMEMTHAVAPNAWTRHLDFVLAGMRTAGLRFSAPALTGEQLDAIVVGHDPPAAQRS